MKTVTNIEGDSEPTETSARCLIRSVTKFTARMTLSVGHTRTFVPALVDTGGGGGGGGGGGAGGRSVDSDELIPLPETGSFFNEKE